MNNIKIESYEIKNSRTEQKIPVVNGVHLHSIYNPYREAESIVEKNSDALAAKSEVLILGLGFAYHVNEIITSMEKNHGADFKIIVIEPNIQVYNDCIDLELLNKKNVLIYAGFTANELYSDVDLVQFLLKKPTVIAHPPSFNLYQLYFKSILTFEAPATIEGALPFIANNEIKTFLKSFDQHSHFNTILDSAVPEKSKFSELDFATMALAEMTKGSRKINSQLNTDKEEV